MKGKWYNMMLEIIFKMFIVLLTGIVSTSNHTKCVLLSNHKCMIQPTLFNLHPNEYSQEFHHYLYSVRLGRFIGSCNTLNDLSNKVYVLNKTEDLNLSVLKHISCKCKCISNGKKNVIPINGRKTINVDVIVKKAMYLKKIIFGILLHVVAKIKNI